MCAQTCVQVRGGRSLQATFARFRVQALAGSSGRSCAQAQPQRVRRNSPSVLPRPARGHAAGTHLYVLDVILAIVVAVVIVRELLGVFERVVIVLASDVVLENVVRVRYFREALLCLLPAVRVLVRVPLARKTPVACNDLARVDVLFEPARMPRAVRSRRCWAQARLRAP